MLNLLKEACKHMDDLTITASNADYQANPDAPKAESSGNDFTI